MLAKTVNKVEKLKNVIRKDFVPNLIGPRTSFIYLLKIALF